MTISSTAFGGVTLTGADAAAFLEQVARERPPAAALAGVRRGRALNAAFRAGGGRLAMTVRPGSRR